MSAESHFHLHFESANPRELAAALRCLLLRYTAHFPESSLTRDFSVIRPVGSRIDCEISSAMSLTDSFETVLRQVPELDCGALEFVLPGDLSEKEDEPFQLTFNRTPRGLECGLVRVGTGGIPGALDRFLTHLERLWNAAKATPKSALGELDYLTPEEQTLLLQDWNTPVVHKTLRFAKPLHRIFEENAARSPERIAVVYEDGQLTYGELNARANRLAHQLLAKGVKKGELVGLSLDRSLELVVAVLGIQKAGGAYVPLDPAYPKDRLSGMLSDCEARFVVTSSDCLELFEGSSVEAILLDQSEQFESASQGNPVTEVGLKDLAYVIYTSGSTGKPKGALMEHGNVTRLFESVMSLYDFSENDTWTLFHSYAFDFSVWEIWGALLHGGKLIVVPYCVSRAPKEFQRLVVREKVTVLNQTPSAFFQFMKEALEAGEDHRLRYVILGGEALNFPALKPWLERFGYDRPRLVNGYGPTETTIFTTFKFIAKKDVEGSGGRTISNLGRPVPDLQVHIVDRALRVVPIGVPGELVISGPGVSRGYYKRPELTAEKFVRSMYRSGDFARFLPDGQIEYLGRIDHQIKIRGFRIELGEIDACLRDCPGVGEAAAIVREDQPGDKYIAAYLVPKAGKVSLSEVRAGLASKLPEYMVPQTFTLLEKLPLSPHGKLDSKALPVPAQTRPELEQPYLAPKSAVEKRLAELWRAALRLDRVGVRDRFFDLGGTSLLATQLLTRMKEAGLEVPAVKLFEHPTIESLAAYLEDPSRGAAEEVQPMASAAPGQDRPGVAIIGMAGRFPGASSVGEFWKNLCQGVESTSFFTEAELDPTVPESLRRAPGYVRARGIIDQIDQFDAAFFGIPPLEATVMDPQKRLFLETSWQALEDAGYAPGSQACRRAGRIGVYGGMYNNSYYANYVMRRPDLIEKVGSFQVMVANEKDYIATRVSHKLDLTGPSISVHTACSTSLVAISQAFQDLVNGACEMALAGGVSVTVPQKSGYVYQEGAMLSIDGHTRSFDARAQGTVFSDGVGVVILKRLDAAIRDGDTIYGVIRGAAINNDGGHKMSFTAPSVSGQAAVITAAQKQAGVDPESISYIEAHGTATPMGDPIEVEALTQAFRRGTDGKGFCTLGSVKSNMGHLTIAAGVTGLLKTVLSLKNEVIPPTLNFEKPNPKCDFANTPFVVNSQLKAWPRSEKPRRAGVSSFGVGGTNAHVILEEAPRVSSSAPAGNRSIELMVVSAKTSSAAAQAVENLRAFARSGAGTASRDVSSTLQMGRAEFNHRAFWVARGETFTPESVPAQVKVTTAAGRNPDVVFLFPGQGSQFAGMGAGLYRDEPVFRAEVDRCAEILKPLLDRDLRELLFSEEGAADAQELLRQTRFTQPALFVVEYAAARLWMSWGVRPDFLVGHSVGEFVCAALAGVIPLEEALRLVALRGRWMGEMPAGAMLSIRQDAAEVEKQLTPGIQIASINSPQLCVVAGPFEEIAALESRLSEGGVISRRLQTSHAFHSAMMEPVVPRFEEEVRRCTWRAPEIPIISTVTGKTLTAVQAQDPEYWARHLRVTVRFADAVQEVLSVEGRVLIELGPRNTLATLARQQGVDPRKVQAFSALGESSDSAAAYAALGEAWCRGVSVDWFAFQAGRGTTRVPLPTYPFERKRFWADALPETAPARAAVQAAPQIPAVSVPFQIQVPVQVQVNQAKETKVMSSQTKLRARVSQILEETSGIDVNGFDGGTSFFEMGMDSLLLTQVATSLGNQFGVKIGFRQLLEEFPNLDSLCAFLAPHAPAEAEPAPVAAPAPAAAPVMAPAAVIPQVLAPAAPMAPMMMPAINAAPGSMEAVIAQQLALMSRQLEMLRGVPMAPMPAVAMAAAPTPAPAPAAIAPSKTESSAAPAKKSEESGDAPDVKKPFGAQAKISLAKDQMSPLQKSRFERMRDRYLAKTAGSKKLAQQNRKVLADPRVVSGFRPILKEIIFPIHTVRSQGARLWDVDGNEYIDMTCGFGTNFLGYVPEFIKDAIKKQLDQGMEIGPQPPMAGDVARLFCEFTKAERVAFCSTGSEALLGAMRLARTITGRKLIVTFTNAYHGIFDEVIVRGNKKFKTFPASPGIMPEAVQNILILDYGTPEALEIIRSRAHELAAVLTEPVQSRNPDLQPREFLHEVRKITEASGTALIIDEVITGFRVAPGGAQEHFGIVADIATYGKVIGGGLPMGIIAGKAKFMDGLDGGDWQFGDESAPTVGVTYFAGTYVRHPLALASAKAVLDYLKQQGPGLQQRLNAKTTDLVNRLNGHFKEVGAPIHIAHFSSMYKVTYTEELAYGELLYILMREKGLHVWDARPCFLTAAHTDEDIETIIRIFKESVAEMQAADFMPKKASATPGLTAAESQPPVPGARLGRDPKGNPAWFVADPERPGKFIKVGASE